MPAEVVIIPKAGHQKHPVWEQGQVFQDEKGDWEAIACRIAEAAYQNGSVTATVCVCPAGTGTSAFDSEYLESLLRRARRHVWGAPLHVVVDPKAWIPRTGEELLNTFRWFETALDAGATDILEVLNLPKERPRRCLEKACRRSATRRSELRRAGRTAPWCAVFAEERNQDRVRFLADFAYDTQADPQAANLIIGIDRARLNEQAKYVEKALDTYRANDFLVAAVRNHAKGPLLDLCAKRTVRWFDCQGLFELRYALLQLKRRGTACAHGTYGEFVEVEVAEPARFPRSPPLLVLTSAFHAGSDPERCIRAAGDVDAVLHGVPNEPEYRVLPGVTTGAFMDLLESSGPVFAWVHMGHGCGGEGLRQYGAGTGTRAEHWLGCFADHNQALPLVFLAACHSAEVAQCFAEAGVGVAVGFRGQVGPEECQFLVRRIMPAALRSQGNPDTILQEFQTGCEQLCAREEAWFREAAPVAFRSKR